MRSIRTYYNAHYNLGVVLAELKDFPGAKEQLEKAIALGAIEPEVHFKLASVLRTLGETETGGGATQVLSAGIQGQADRTLATSKAAQAAIGARPAEGGGALSPGGPSHSGRSPAAVQAGAGPGSYGRYCRRTDDLGASHQDRSRLGHRPKPAGLSRFRSGDSASAEEHFRLALQAAPAYVQAWVSLAATLGMESRFPEARKRSRNALRLDPQNAEALQLRKDLTAAQAQR